MFLLSSASPFFSYQRQECISVYIFCREECSLLLVFLIFSSAVPCETFGHACYERDCIVSSSLSDFLGNNAAKLVSASD